MGGSAAHEPDGLPEGRTTEVVPSSVDRETTDPRVDALLRAHATQSPPAHVDAAILAAAHRAVGSAPRKAGSPLAGGPLRWWMPLAAAAVIGVVVINILPLAPTAPPSSPAVVDDAPAAPTRRDAPPKPERRSASSAPSEFAAAPSNAPVSPAPAAPVPSEAARKPHSTPLPTQKQPKADAIAPEARVGAAAMPPAADPGAAANATTPRPAAAQASTAKVMRESAGRDTRQEASADWLARIRALHDAGKETEARAELARFRASFVDADARLPADLRAWAASVR